MIDANQQIMSRGSALFGLYFYLSDAQKFG